MHLRQLMKLHCHVLVSHQVMALSLHTSPIGCQLCESIIILENLVVNVIQKRVDGIYALIDLIRMWRFCHWEVQLTEGRSELIDDDSYFRYVLTHLVICLVQLLNVVFHHLHLLDFERSCCAALEAEPLRVSW